jgi:hypothetical protein
MDRVGKCAEPHIFRPTRDGITIPSESAVPFANFFSEALECFLSIPWLNFKGKFSEQPLMSDPAVFDYLTASFNSFFVLDMQHPLSERSLMRKQFGLGLWLAFCALFAIGVILLLETR